MRHRVPIHLDQPDRILWGLTARQVLMIAAGIGGAYLLWSSLAALTAAGIFGALTVGLMAACIILVGIIAAFVAPGGRCMEEWAIVALAYVLAPKIYLWNSLPAIDAYTESKPDKDDNQTKQEEDETW